MARKTIEVGTLLGMANHFLASENTNADERESVAAYIESVLHATGNYAGFKYLELKIRDDNTVETLGAGTRRAYFACESTVDAYQEFIRAKELIGKPK